VFWLKLCVQLSGVDICRQHCAVEYVNGVVVIMPLDHAASVRVDNSRIYSATPLSHGASVLVGSQHLFQFVDPVALQVNQALDFWCKNALDVFVALKSKSHRFT